MSSLWGFTGLQAVQDYLKLDNPGSSSGKQVHCWNLHFLLAMELTTCLQASPFSFVRCEIHASLLSARWMFLIPGLWVPKFDCLSDRDRRHQLVMFTGETLVIAYRKVVFMLFRNLRRLKKASLEYAQTETLSWVRNAESTRAVRFLFLTLFIPLRLRITHTWMPSLSHALMAWNAKIYLRLSRVVELQGGSHVHFLRSNV